MDVKQGLLTQTQKGKKMKELKIKSGQSLTCSKIIAVGRNYSEHIREMGAVPTGEPILFLKPATSLCDINQPLFIPSQYGAVHHELELALLIGRGGRDITEQKALEHIAGYGLALDLTLRDLQAVAKKKGMPWAVAKGFDGACPITPVFVPREYVPDPHKLEIMLKINGEIRQQGNTSHMIFSLPFLIAYISRFFTLEEGDVILTGTPSGVGQLHDGDQLEARLDGVADVRTEIKAV